MPVHLVVAAASFAAATLIAVCGTIITADAAGAIVLEDQIARKRFEYLRERSATMQQMLAVITAVPGVLVRVRAVPGLHQSAAVNAHGFLQVDEESVHAALEFDPIAVKPPEQIEMLAHELAHVVEVVCLPRSSGADALRRALLERGFAVRRQRVGRIGIETPFAVQAGRRAAVEAMNGGKLPGLFASLARRHALGEPCTPPTDTAAPRRAFIQ